MALRDAATQVVQTLRVTYCEIFELPPGGDSLVLRARAGWKGRTPTGAKAPPGAGSLARYALLSREPVIVENLREEKRFKVQRSLREGGMISGIGILIPGRSGPLGILTACARERRKFTKADVHFLQATANGAGAAIDRERAENALRDSEAKWRSLVEEAPDMIITIDRNCAIQFINRTVQGFTVEGTLGTSVYDYIASDHHDVFKRAIHRVFRRGTVERIEIVGDGPNGSVVWYASRIGPIRRDGKIIGATIITSDVTERKQAGAELRRAHSELEQRVQRRTAELRKVNEALRAEITERRRAEQALRHSEELFHSLVASIDESIVAYDTEMRVTFWSPTMERMSGIPTKKALGKTPFGALPFLDEVGEGESMRDAARGKATFRAETPYYVPGTGRRGYFESSHFPMRDAGGRIIGGVGIIRDVTERRRVEEALRLTQFSVDNAAEAVFWMGRNARFHYVNEAACRSLGYSRQELLSMSVHDIDPDFPPEVWPEHWEEVKKRGSFTLQSHHRTKSGRVFPVEVTVNHLEFSGTEYHCAFVRDITERIRTETVLRSVVEGTSAATGDGFFHSLVRNLASALNARYALIGEVGGPAYDRVRTLAVWSGDDFGENFEYDLAGTPCENVVGQRLRHYPKDVQKLFPEDHLLVEMGVESYLGTPLFDPSGDPLGILVVLNDGPLDAAPNPEAVLATFATRAGVEISRMRAEDALRESEKKYRSIFENVQDIFYRTDITGIITEISPSVERYAYTRQGLIGTQVLDVYEDPEERAGLVNALLERGEVADYEIHLKTGDGRVVDTSVSAHLTRDADGTPTGIEGSLRDISERVRAEKALRESEEKYRDLVENLSEIIYTLDRDGIVTYVSPAVEPVSGYSPSEVIGRSFTEFVHPDDLAPLVESYQRTIAGALEPSEYRLVSKSGEIHWVRSSSRPIVEGDRVVGLRALLVDITDRKRAEKALRQSEERLRTVVTNSPVVLFATDSEGVFTLSEGKGLALLGLQPGEVVGRSVFDVYREAPEIIENVRRALAGEEFTAEVDLGELAFETRYTPVRNQSGATTGVIGLATDVTERKVAEAELVRMANHDQLTGVLNRRRFEEELERELAQARRHGTHGAVLFLDLDQFKDVNDSLGHRAGDELLASLAALLRARLRDTDIVARPGGDEFAMLLPHTNAKEARIVAEQVLDAMRRHTFGVGQQSIAITASIGIAMFPSHGVTAGELLSHADLAMYQAKENGRNCSYVYQTDGDWQAQIESRLGLQNRIREALDMGQLLLHAQPILDLRSKHVSQYELLVRLKWGNKLVNAGDFVGVAERFGLVQAIDRWVVSRAIRLIAEHREKRRELTLAVNLSGMAFKDSQMLPLIRRELAANSVDPACLVLEVTESAAIANITEAQVFVETLRGLGCRFALDDFGVGFSSFYHLKHLPVDYLKIDGGFISNLPRNPVDQHLVQAMVQVARGLGKQTIAEFVGCEETVRLLQEYGVDYAQGYHLGRPDDATKVLSRARRRSARAA